MKFLKASRCIERFAIKRGRRDTAASACKKRGEKKVIWNIIKRAKLTHENNERLLPVCISRR